MSAPTVPANRYRTDIQGLRAIGMALVVLGHIWFDKVSGGVDVFFVISAYLTTRSLVGRASQGKPIEIAAFWGRIALRILPAGMTVIGLTFVAGWFLLPVTLWRSFVTNGVMSVLQLENVQLLRESTDYLARGTPATPFQQLWALSTQMQFFAVLPLMVALCVWMSRRLGHDYDRRAHLVWFGAMAFGSFAFALWILAINPAPHYFNPAARLWEFAVGSILAVLVDRVRMSAIVALVLGWAGLALIVATAAVIPASAPFPGLAALMPVGGAAMMLIAGGGGKQPGGSAGALLSAPILQRAATISFTVYLCHWPILVFYQEAVGTTRLSVLQGGTVVAIAVVAAIAIKRLVEDPMRRAWSAPWLQRRRPAVVRMFPFAVAAVLAVANLAMAASWQRHFQGIETRYLATPRVPAPPRPILRGDTRLPAGIDPQLITIGDLLPEPYGNGCDTKERSSEVVVCVTGSRNSRAPVIALIGGSHSTQWYPAFKTIVGRHDLRLVSITKSACPIDGVYNGFARTGASAQNCRLWAEEAVRRVIALKPAMVFTTATRPGPGNFGDVVPASFVRVWRTLTAHGIPVLAIRDTPRAETYRVPVCIDRNRDDPTRCDMVRATHLSDPSPVAGGAPIPLVRFMDLSDYICAPTRCPVLIDGIVVYHDNSHLSVPFVERLTPLLEAHVLSFLTVPKRARAGFGAAEKGHP
jgi:peptidoglycan/LPS O-acetylase OafA/YrhL